MLAATDSPEVLLANHYVRYLGDLSGGHVVSRLVQRHYGMDNDVIAFYEFPAIEKAKVYKDEYRPALDALGERIDAAQRARILTAAAESFEHNRAVFVDLTAARPGEHLAAGVPA